MVLLQERVAAVLLQRLHGCPVHSFNVPQLALAAAHPDLGQGAMRTAAALRPSASTQVLPPPLLCPCAVSSPARAQGSRRRRMCPAAHTPIVSTL
jgi:hypothetical protein